MRVRPRFWTVVGLAIFFACLTVLFRRPVFVVGTAGLCAWVLGSQYAFAWTVVRVDSLVTVDQEITPDGGVTSEEFEITLSVSSPSTLSLPVTVSLQPSPAVTELSPESRTCRLNPGTQQAKQTGSFRCPVAGTVSFEAPRLTLSDRFGLFEKTIRMGEPETVPVNPGHSTGMRVSQGANQGVADANFRTRGGTESLVYHGVREYVPADAAKRIDWRATARLGELKVVEYEKASDRTFALLVDRRSSLTNSGMGQTKFDYCREAALAIVDDIEQLGDELALCVFDGDGITTMRGPEDSPEWYSTVRAILRDLDAQSSSDSTNGTAPLDSLTRRRVEGEGQLDNRAFRQLTADETPFAKTIRPFCLGNELNNDNGADERDPLAQAVEGVLKTVTGDVWTVMLTDDSRRTETKASVQLASRANNRVFLFLTPTSLYEPGGFSDIEETYQDYREFESFRRELDNLPRVHAFEISPEEQRDTESLTKRIRRERTD